MKGWYFIIDVEKCENCNNCFLACKDEHVGNEWTGYAAPQPDQGAGWMKITGKERGKFPLIDVAYLPMHCMHCDDAPCLRSAENGSVYKRPDGLVIIDAVRARGQRELVKTCPYGLIRWNDHLSVPQKCTGCAHLIDEGWTKSRCIQSCPTGALSMRYLDGEAMKEIIRAEGLETYRSDLKTRPRVYYKNLYRFTRCFIAGSVAAQKDGRDECVQGAEVVLSDSAGRFVATTSTDNYGDFKFDNLEEGSGIYRVSIRYAGHGQKLLEMRLEHSTDVGVVYV